MPGENVAFEAFGQNHTDKSAIEAVATRLEVLHSQMQMQGKQLVIGIEHSEKDVRQGRESIRQLHNSGVVQTYCDAVHKVGKKPEFGDFITNHLKDLKWASEDSDTSRTISSTGDLGPVEYLNMSLFFSAHAAVSTADVNVGRGPSKIEEAGILQWAMVNKVPVVGLDPLSDEEKRQRLTDAKGRIKNDALKEVEYERVQGMASRAAGVMNDLSGGGGGCLVAINMGAAHLASLEVALRGELQVRGMEKAEVQMRVPISKESLTIGETAQEKMEKHLHTSVSDMRGDLPQLERRLAYVEKGRQDAELVLNERRDALKRLGRLPEGDNELRELIKTNPGQVADILNEGLTQKHAKIKPDAIEKLGLKLAKSPEADAHELLKGKLDSRVKEMEDALVEHDNDVALAKGNLASYQETNRAKLDFAQKVEERIQQKPEGVFTPLTQGVDGQYDLSVLEKSSRQTVGESLGGKVSSSTTHRQQEQEIDSNDKSTRAQLKRSRSLPELGSSLSGSSGGTTQKVHL